MFCEKHQWAIRGKKITKGVTLGSWKNPVLIYHDNSIIGKNKQKQTEK
jgi:hypothetical protein